jgi:hypothetical protein
MAVGFSKKPNLYIISLFHFVVLYSAVLTAHLVDWKEDTEQIHIGYPDFKFLRFWTLYFGVAPWTTVG